MWNIKGTAHKEEKPHEKLQKNKQIADTIKNLKNHIRHSKTKCSSSELWVGFPKLCQKQQTTINTGVTGKGL
jgi:hypothetical protein